MQDTSGVHVWLVLGKAFRALATRAEESLNLGGTGLGDSEFRVLEVLLHRGSLPVNTIGPKVWPTPGSISVAVDRLEKKALVNGRIPGTGAFAWSSSRRKAARSSPKPFGSMQRPWKRLPASTHKRSGK